MSLFQNKPDPFSDELKKLEEESRRVEEKMRRLEARMGESLPEPAIQNGLSEHFKGAMFKDADPLDRETPPMRKALKIQKRKIRNRVILLGVILLILLLLVLRALA
jgi:hypothetical protein